MNDHAEKISKAVKRITGKEETMIEAIIEKAKSFMKEEEAMFTKENLLKYAAIATVVIYGLRTGGWVRNLILSAVATMVTEHLVEGSSDEKATK